MRNSQKARAIFPSGLYQPEGSFRFSVDALLLGSFIKKSSSSGMLVADIGAGCGIVGLTHLLDHPKSCCVGLEVQGELVAAAHTNARHLGCADRYVCLEMDIALGECTVASVFQQALGNNASIKQQLVVKKTPAPEGFDLVLANPPYRVLGTGRLPKSLSRQKALFAPLGTLERFCGAAYSLMKAEGYFGLVFPAAQQSVIVDIVHGCGLYVERCLSVLGRQGKEATLILLLARKIPVASCPYEAPLVLYAHEDTLSRAAVDFCPYLARGV